MKPPDLGPGDMPKSQSDVQCRIEPGSPRPHHQSAAAEVLSDRKHGDQAAQRDVVKSDSQVMELDPVVMVHGHMALQDEAVHAEDEHRHH